MRPDEYRRMFDAEDRFWWYVGTRELVQREVSRTSQRLGEHLTILDAGCGTGANLEMLRNYGTAHGLDLSSEALRFCNQRGLRNLVHGSVMALPYASRSLGVVTSIDVLYHRWVADDDGGLAEIARVLKPGGVLITQVAALELLRGSHDEVVFTRKRYKRSELAAKLMRAGFRLQKLTYRNSLLFPAVLPSRLLSSARSEIVSDVRMPNSTINACLLAVVRLENWMLRWMNFPVGSSVFAVAIRE